ncbi:uncharacterized protein [Magallana gigas]|uniref:uncharacterized protein n=1 Tax=Magallana gigas TaxID=29159 RepID=UPI0033405E80
MKAIFLTLIGSALFWVTTEAADAFAVELYDKTSIYGDFDKEDECWTDGPENPTLPVSDDCIPASTKLKIEYLLRKNPSVLAAIKEKYIRCDNSYYKSVGLTNVCPSEVAYPTKVQVYGTMCYVVKPESQCIRYAKCEGKSGCLENDASKSECLMDSFRQFDTWIYCENCGFRLVQLRLPQCCTCSKYEECQSGSG